MLLSLLASSSRAPLRRGLATSTRTMAKANLRASPNVETPMALLEKIGRGTEKRLASHAESWQSLNEAWQKGSVGIKDSGLSVKDRRYVVGADPNEFISPPKGAKDVRGWGPRVQNGVRVR